MSDSGEHDEVPHKGADTPPWRVVQSPAVAPQDRDPATSEQDDSAKKGRSAPRRGRGSDPADPRQKAMELLSRREHSRLELTGKLVARGFEADAAERVVEEMATRGWQDDARYAEVMARHRMMSGHGPVRIRADLRQHGIGSEMIEAALVACETDWPALATDVLQRRFGMERPADRKEIARRGAFLQRRGFDLDAIRHAMAQIDG